MTIHGLPNTVGTSRWSDARPRRYQFQCLSPSIALQLSCCCSMGWICPTPSKMYRSRPAENRTYHYWHVFVPGVAAGQIYGYRIAGPFDPERGLRFDPSKVLLDPYGKCIAVPAGRSRDAAREPGDNMATALKSVVVDPSSLRLGGRCTSRPALCQDDHLRDACRRVHPASEFRRRAGKARHLRRPDREDPLSAGSRNQRCRTAAGICIRRAGRPAGPR